MGANVPVEDGITSLMPPHPFEPLLQQEGACVGSPREWFFPLSSGARSSGADRSTNLMKQGVRVCQTQCPVMAECREFGDYLEKNRTNKTWVFGVWGGEAPADRIKRRKAEKLRRVA